MVIENLWKSLENVHFPFPQLMPALQVSEVVQLGKPDFQEILLKTLEILIFLTAQAY